jgi:hypothetical protein
MACRVHKRVRQISQKEVVCENLLCLAQLLLRLLKVKVDVKSLDEQGERIRVFIPFLVDYSCQILELLAIRARVSRSRSTRDNGGCEVAEEPWAECLDGVDIGGREE